MFLIWEVVIISKDNAVNKKLIQLYKHDYKLSADTFRGMAFYQESPHIFVQPLRFLFKWVYSG